MRAAGRKEVFWCEGRAVRVKMKALAAFLIHVLAELIITPSTSGI